MNEVTEVQTELNGIIPDTILELTPSNAVGIGFITAHNKLYRIIKCNLVAKATDSSPKDRHVCLIENLDSHYFNTRFFTLQFSKALKMFNSKKSVMPDIETELEMKARWKTMQIPDKHIFALLHRSDSAQCKAMEKYIKKHNAIQFSSTEKTKTKQIKQSSPSPVESKVELVETKKESKLDIQNVVYPTELNEDNQLIVNCYFILDESVQNNVFTKLPLDVKTAIYERLPVARQIAVLETMIAKRKNTQ
jgi:hypothetical protein